MTRSRVFGLSGQSAAGSESARLTVALESRHRRAISAMVTPEARSEAVERAIEEPFNSWRCNRLQLDHATVAGATDFHRDRGGRKSTNNRDDAKRAKKLPRRKKSGVIPSRRCFALFAPSRFPLFAISAVESTAVARAARAHPVGGRGRGGKVCDGPLALPWHASKVSAAVGWVVRWGA